jgi:excisionase family DNA binding protein
MALRAFDDDFVTVAEAAAMLRVASSTIRRWIREGELPAYRIGKRRVALKRADLEAMIGPARSSGSGVDAGRNGRMRSPRLTPEEKRRGLEAMEQAQRISQQILARRGGELFSPSWTTLGELREERTRQLG